MTERKRAIWCVPILLTIAVCAAPGAEAQLREPEQRFFISIDGGFQGGSQQVQNQAVSPDVFGEDQITATDHDIDRTAAVGRANVVATLWGNLGVGLGYTVSFEAGDGAVTVMVPHPIFTNRPRTASSDLTNLRHRADMFHFQAVYIVPLDDRAQLQIFGGPSVMTVEQAVVTGATAGPEVPPFTTVTLDSVQRQKLTNTGLGFNVGMDFAYMFGDTYGAGVFVQYAGGSLNFESRGGPSEVTVGGIQFGGGLRFRF